MKIVATALAFSFISLSALAADYSYYNELLQSKLTFSGQVEVTSVVAQENGDFVQLNVSSDGEYRSNWCLIAESQILQCQDNWFMNEEDYSIRENLQYQNIY